MNTKYFNRLKTILASTLVFVLLLNNSAKAQTTDYTKLDTFFTRLNTHNKAMASIAVYKNGKKLYTNAIGYKKIDGATKIPVNINTKYRIGSITKMFTATMVMQLVDEKKLTLNTKLSAFFPKIANAQKITIAHMLNHHSGIHNFTNDDSYLNYYTTPKTKAELLEIFYTMPADFEPGKKAQYSNTAYVLLGYIIEEVTGKSYAQALNKRIIEKADLKGIYYGSATDVKKNEAYSYTFNDNKWVQEAETNMNIPHGAGAIVSTASAVAQFSTALFQGKLCSDSLLKKITTMQDGYGMGCFELPFYERVSYGHTGGIDGFTSMLGYFTDDSLAIALTCNGNNYPANDIMINALSIIYKNDTYKVPSFTSKEIDSKKLKAYEGVYATPDFPLKVTILSDGKNLIAQATGQAPFPLNAENDSLFRFDEAGIVINFIIEESGAINQFNFKQGAAKFLFTKE